MGIIVATFVYGCLPLDCRIATKCDDISFFFPLRVAINISCAIDKRLCLRLSELVADGSFSTVMANLHHNSVENALIRTRDQCLS